MHAACRMRPWPCQEHRQRVVPSRMGLRSLASAAACSLLRGTTCTINGLHDEANVALPPPASHSTSRTSPCLCWSARWRLHHQRSARPHRSRVRHRNTPRRQLSCKSVSARWTHGLRYCVMAPIRTPTSYAREAQRWRSVTNAHVKKAHEAPSPSFQVRTSCFAGKTTYKLAFDTH